MNRTPYRPIEQTHFVGVRIPEELERTLEGLRDYMKTRYGCRSGQSTPLHITLIPPFCASKGVTDQYLMDMMRYALSPLVEEGKLPFSAVVNGFGSFGDRTLYAHVEKNPLWSELKRAVEEEFLQNRVGDVKKEKKTFVPHITIANRDIPMGALPEALSRFSSVGMENTFPVSSLCLFVREKYRWVEKKENLLVL